MPVGFVNAAESKAMLMKRQDMPYVTLEGRKGINQLFGGDGNDVFKFDDFDVDIVQDFNLGTNKVYLDGDVFGGLGAGVMSSGVNWFYTWPGAPSPAIYYTSGNGYIFYDEDGSLPTKAGQLIATLLTTGGGPATSPLVDASDFVVY